MDREHIEILQKEAIRLVGLEIAILEKMQSMKGILSAPTDGEDQTFDRDSVPECINMLEGELHKLENLEMVLAVVGTMKSGKSTTINAIVGCEVLPSRNRAMTSLPTLIEHTPGQIEPVLSFNGSALKPLIAKIKKLLNRKEQDYKDFFNWQNEKYEMAALIEMIKSNNDFGGNCRGVKSIFLFLQRLNDLVRLCAELNQYFHDDIEFPFDRYDDPQEIPRIKVEFTQLSKEQQAVGKFILMDTPGHNEAGQPQMRHMHREQLSKASAVLAVLDFTQLGTEADDRGREDIKEIVDVTNERFYVLVNKFDQADRHSDSIEEVKKRVSADYFNGIISEDAVFPVSSQLGYLASYARHALSVHGKLPQPVNEKNKWVIDFGTKAFGELWEDNLSDLDQVRKATNKLWDKSRFQIPIDEVIRSAHAGAALLAVDAAAAKLADVSKNMTSFVGLRTSALKKSVRELQKQIDQVKATSEQIIECERRAKSSASKMLQGLDDNLEKCFDSASKEIDQAIDDYFKEGKRIEKNNHALVSTRKPRNNNSLSPLRRLFDTDTCDFDPKSPVIKFTDETQAQELVNKIQYGLNEIIKASEGSLNVEVDNVLKTFQENFITVIKKEVDAIAQSLAGRLKDSGFDIEVEPPDVHFLKLKYTSSDMLNDMIEKTPEQNRYRQRQSGIWGGICKLFNTDDWGWETHSEEIVVYRVDTKEIRKRIKANIQKIFDDLDAVILKKIKAPLDESMEAYFGIFKKRVEKISGDLLQGLRDQEASKVEQEELATRLDDLKKNIEPVLRDSKGLVMDMQDERQSIRGIAA